MSKSTATPLMGPWGLPGTVTACRALAGSIGMTLTKSRSLQSLTTCSRPRGVLQRRGASHEVSSPSALEAGEIHSVPKDRHQALPARLCSTFRVSHPLDGFLPPLPARPCFVPVTLMGFRPSELFPSTEPLRLSTPAPLLPLSEARCDHAPCIGSSTETIALVSTHPTPASPTLRSTDRLQGLIPRRSPSPGLWCYPPPGSMLSWASILLRVSCSSDLETLLPASLLP